MMNTAKKWTAFSAYIISIAVVFLYVLFPSDTMKTYVGYRLEKLMPQVDFEIQQLHLSVPPGLSFQKVAMNYMKKPAARFEQVVLTPNYLSLLTSNASAEFSGELAGGTVSGWTGTQNGALVSEMTFADIRLDDLPIIDMLAAANVSGKTGGEIKYSSSGKSTATLSLTDCQFELKQAIMGIRRLEFTRIDADAEMMGQRVSIKRIDFEGPQASGSGDGTVVLRQPIETSRINLSGKIIPRPSLMQSVGALLPQRYLKEGGIPVRITGTLNRPNFSIR